MRYLRRSKSQLALIVLIASIGFGFGPVACPFDSSEQPRTVADIMVAAGNVKRDLRERERQVPGTGITAQQDYDISFRLAQANRAYKQFIDDELARLAANPDAPPNPDARRNAINALVTSLKSIEDPGAIGIKSDGARKLWREGIKGLGTVIAGLEMLRGGQ